MEQVLAGGDKRKSGVTFAARPMADPDGMVLRSFADGRVWMNTCRMVELSGTVVASTAGQARSLHQYQLWRWVGGRRRRRPVRRTGLDPVTVCGWAGASGFRC